MDNVEQRSEEEHQIGLEGEDLEVFSVFPQGAGCCVCCTSGSPSATNVLSPWPLSLIMAVRHHDMHVVGVIICLDKDTKALKDTRYIGVSAVETQANNQAIL